MNKTRIAAALAAIAAAYCGATWYTGKQIEQRLRAETAGAGELAARQWPALEVRLALPQYERGVFHSRMRHTLALTDPDTGKHYELAIASRIAHGPLPVAEVRHGRLAPVLAAIHSQLQPTPSTQPWFDLATGKPVLDGRSLIRFGGGAQLAWQFAPLDGKVNGVSLRFGGAALQGETDPGRQSLRLSGQAGSLQLSDGLAGLDLRELALDSDTRKGRHGFGLGDSRLSLQSLAIARTGAGNVALRGIEAKASLDEDGRSLAGRASWTVEQAAIGSLPLGSMQAALAFERVDAPALRALVDAYAAHLEEALAEPDDGQALPEPPSDALQPLIQAVLAGGPVVTLEPVSWTTPDGSSDFRLRMTAGVLERAAAPGVSPPDAAGPRESGQSDQSHKDGVSGRPDASASAAQALSGLRTLDARLSVSRPMAAGVLAGTLAAEGSPPDEARQQARSQIDALAAMALSMKLAREDGDKLVAELAYRDGTVDLNGETIDAAQVLPLLGMAAGENGANGEDGAPWDEGGPAPALQAVGGEDVIEALQANGFAAQLGRDDAGDPLVTVALDPQRYGTRQASIEFYGCASGGCDDMLLQARPQPAQPVALKTVNGRNAQSRWVRAYLDEDRQPVLEMDINAYGGLGEEALESLLLTFFVELEDFAEALGVPEEAGPAP